MSFEFAKINSRTEPYLALDKYGRIRLSKGAQDKLNINAAFSPWVAVAYDKETQSIALQKEELVKSAPADAKTKVDAKSYIHVRPFLRRNNIAVGETARFIYDGEVSVKGERFHSFRRASDE